MRPGFPGGRRRAPPGWPAPWCPVPRCPAGGSPARVRSGAVAAAPAATSSGTRSGASAWPRVTTGLRRPKAKSAANAITASEYSTTATIRKSLLRWARPWLSGISLTSPRWW